VLRSLNEYNSYEPVHCDDREALDEAVYFTAERQPKWSRSYTGDDEDFDRAFDKVIGDAYHAGTLNGDSSPGYPYNLRYKDNRTFIEEQGAAGGELRRMVYSRYQKWKEATDETVEECIRDPKQWILKGLRDPVRLFPKNQGVPKRKNGLPRLICAVSLVDQIVERLFFDDYCKAELEAFPNLDGMKGIGFDDVSADAVGGRWRGRCHQTGLTPLESDVSGWEKRFGAMFAYAHAMVMRLTCKNNDAGFESATLVWSGSLLSVPIVVGNGTVWIRRGLKIQTSGDRMTSESNTNGRKVAARLVGSLAFCAGDDCNEWNSAGKDEIMARYAKIGLPVRDVIKHETTTFFNFCSHGFRFEDDQWKCWLNTYPRMMWECARKNVWDAQTDNAIRWEVRHHPDPKVRERVDIFLDVRKFALCSCPEHDVIKTHEEQSSTPGGGQSAKEGCYQEEEQVEETRRRDDKGRPLIFPDFWGSEGFQPEPCREVQIGSDSTVSPRGRGRESARSIRGPHLDPDVS